MQQSILLSSPAVIALAREREELKRDGEEAHKAFEEHNRMEEERIAR